jgi:uncharacterized metal-binding protein
MTRDVGCFNPFPKEIVMQAQQCKCGGGCGSGANAGETLVFACSGAADVGEIADRAARELHRAGAARMFCLAAVGARLDDALERTRGAARRVVIDGCDQDCGMRTMAAAGVGDFEHLRVTSLGIEKGNSPATPERIGRVVDQVRARLA